VQLDKRAPQDVNILSEIIAVGSRCHLQHLQELPSVELSNGFVSLVKGLSMTYICRVQCRPLRRLQIQPPAEKPTRT
jgi:hypothetical protein